MPPYLAFANSNDVLVIGGEAKINGQQQRSTKAEVFTLNAGAKGSVIKSKDQIFYLDPETEANFYRNDDGLMSNVIITAGGMLSLFGKSLGVMWWSARLMRWGRSGAPQPISHGRKKSSKLMCVVVMAVLI